MPRRSSIALGLLAAVPYALLASGEGSVAQPASATTVLGILKAKCISCHTSAAASGGLNLTSEAGLRKGGVSGKAVLPKDSKRSVLMQRIRGEGGKPRMPMGFSPLSKAQTDAIASWIDAGAPSAPRTGRHSAYVKPIRPPLLVIVNNHGDRDGPDYKWAKNPIDYYTLYRIHKAGLKPSPEASKETLLRRASLDLIGLPPTPQEIDTFLADKRPDAYERQVDRLLASPHYGERQARAWLDLARYADSDGYEKDLNRTAWKYRDWVINAFNRNLPYDQFTIEQLAGDLLPKPKQDQLIATGFHRNSMFNREGGVDQEEAHHLVITDRVDTTATVWLGSTMACARCHDHKYDPFSQKDYYRLAAFYSNTVVLPRGPKEVGEEKWFEPEIEAPTPQQAAEKEQLKKEIAAAEPAVAWKPELKSQFEEWLEVAKSNTIWLGQEPVSLASSKGAVLSVDSGMRIVVAGENPATDTYTVKMLPQRGSITGIRIDAFADDKLPGKGPGRAYNGNFVITKVKLLVAGKEVKLARAVADYSQRDFPAQNVFKGDPNTGWAVSGALGRSHVLVVEPEKPVDPLGAEVEVVIEQNSIYAQHALGSFRLSFTSSPNPADSVLPEDVSLALRKPERTEKDIDVLRKHFLATTPLLAEPRIRLAGLKQKLDKLQSEIPTALVLKEKPLNGPLVAYVRTRGEFLSKAEKVSAGTPAILPILKTTKANRLALAKWLASKDNPLTARVQVNRMWEQYFGRGIVETSEDFGTQGARPVNQPLLDWLACELMDRNWDLKAIHRLIVTSATYRQSSNVTPALLKRDPQNILHARGPRFRLEAEMIRDNALAASGLLTRKIGGPSVYPVQPEGVWDNPFSDARWTTSTGPDRYRRGMYTFLKRTAPYPNFLVFDSTSRETCTVRRVRTNTPLQALAMLNDPALFDAAKALGERMLKEGGPNAKAKLAYGFLLCTGRGPNMAESGRLQKLLASLQAKYEIATKEATKLGGPEKAVWAMVGNVLLNLDETITKN